jgi:probable rRNA maturation factor
MENSCSVTNTTKSPLPRLPFHEIKNRILGNQYAVSVVFVGETRARSINKAWRKKTYIPNVLAFEVANDCGEIYITPKVAAREASQYGHSVAAHTGFLFIHALLHLKGHAHGDTMEKAEKRYMKMFNII